MVRRAARFPFSASAEVTSDDSIEFTRVTELRLSRYGCYLETAKHRTPGTPTDNGHGRRLPGSKTSLPDNSGGLAAAIIKRAESSPINREFGISQQFRKLPILYDETFPLLIPALRAASASRRNKLNSPNRNTSCIR
jgi:hypothetical protein